MIAIAECRFLAKRKSLPLRGKHVFHLLQIGRMPVYQRLSCAWILCPNGEVPLQDLHLGHGCDLRSLLNDDDYAVVLTPLLAPATSDWQRFSTLRIRIYLFQLQYKLVLNRNTVHMQRYISSCVLQGNDDAQNIFDDPESVMLQGRRWVVDHSPINMQ